jgi:hypothetical protein
MLHLDATKLSFHPASASEKLAATTTTEKKSDARREKTIQPIIPHF